LRYWNPFWNGGVTKEIGLRKTPIFRLQLVAMATSLEKSKKLNELNKPFHLSTNPENLVKIGLLASDKQVLLLLLLLL